MISLLTFAYLFSLLFSFFFLFCNIQYSGIVIGVIVGVFLLIGLGYWFLTTSSRKSYSYGNKHDHATHSYDNQTDDHESHDHETGTGDEEIELEDVSDDV
jgi:hypothetical protein